jgi:nicotinamide mononucleotide transporter
MLEIIGTIVGIFYLWLEYKARIHLWIAGIIMPAIYIFVYYDAGLYADFGINIYYLLVAVYGWVMWKYGGKLRRFVSPKTKKKEVSRELPITNVPKRVLLLLALVALAVFLLIAFILIRFTDSNVPWLDSFTTALSIVGMWMLAKKYVEQWWVWIVVDLVSAGLYIYKDLHFTAVLYFVYAIIAIFGYRKWKGMME